MTFALPISLYKYRLLNSIEVIQLLVTPKSLPISLYKCWLLDIVEAIQLLVTPKLFGTASGPYIWTNKQPTYTVGKCPRRWSDLAAFMRHDIS